MLRHTSCAVAMLGSMSFARTERNRLASLLHDLGPDAPTLCEGWTTKDMAVHLWVRENRLDAAAGMFIPALDGHLDKVSKQVADKGYDDIVREWGSGPGKFSPFRLIDSKANLAENFIHHEDVRRANGQEDEREFSTAIEKQLHGVLKMLAPRMLSKSTSPVVLFPRGLARVVCADKQGVAKDGQDVVRVHGSVGEILLWVYGRDAAHVSIEGPVESVKRSSL